MEEQIIETYDSQKRCILDFLKAFLIKESKRAIAVNAETGLDSVIFEVRCRASQIEIEEYLINMAETLRKSLAGTERDPMWAENWKENAAPVLSEEQLHRLIEEWREIDYLGELEAAQAAVKDTEKGERTVLRLYPTKDSPLGAVVRDVTLNRRYPLDPESPKPGTKDKVLLGLDRLVSSPTTGLATPLQVEETEAREIYIKGNVVVVRQKDPSLWETAKNLIQVLEYNANQAGLQPEVRKLDKDVFNGQKIRRPEEKFHILTVGPGELPPELSGVLENLIAISPDKVPVIEMKDHGLNYLYPEAVVVDGLGPVVPIRF